MKTELIYINSDAPADKSFKFFVSRTAKLNEAIHLYNRNHDINVGDLFNMLEKEIKHENHIFETDDFDKHKIGAQCAIAKCYYNQSAILRDLGKDYTKKLQLLKNTCRGHDWACIFKDLIREMEKECVK